MTITVALADDQALVRSGFRLILETQPDLEVVAEAADGRELLDVVHGRAVDVVLMDVRMPVMDGIEATRRLIAEHPRAPKVLILTTFDLDEHVLDALRVGASGFLLKDVTRDQLVDAVRVIAAGEALLSPTITRRMIRHLLEPPAPPAPRPVAVRPPPLTPRETDVLRLVASGLSNAEIAAALTVSHNTVKTHVANVLGKLHLRDRVHAVIYGYETGLVGRSPGFPNDPR